MLAPLTWLTPLQLLLAAAVIWIVVERVRLLLYRAPLDTGRWLRAVRAAMDDGDSEAVQALVEAGRPAWIAETARAALAEGPEAAGELEELLADYRYDAFKGLRALRILASAATASGFFGAVLEIIWLLEGDHGLMGLEAGRVESIAASRALIAVAIGVSVSVFAFVSLGILKRAAVKLVADVRRVAAELERVE